MQHDDEDPQLLELSVADLDGELVEAVAEVLGRWSALGAVVEQYPPRRALAEDGPLDPAAARFVVKVYLEQHEGSARAVQQVKEALWHLGRIRPLPDLSVRPVAREARATFRPLRPGRLLRILPPGAAPSPAPAHDVVIEPGAAFGIGSHPSTQCAVVLLEEVLRGGERVLDVGSGSGILSVAAVRLGAARAIACDREAAAARSTRANAARNDLGDRVHVFQGTLDALRAARPFDVIAMNIVLRVIAQLLPRALALLDPRGTLIVAGILDHQEEEWGRLLRQHALSVRDRVGREDWRGFAVRHEERAGRELR